MGKRGPKKTPTEILKKRGSWRGDKRAKHEVQPKRIMADAPIWLSDEATFVWGEIYEKLKQYGILSELDEKTLERYCIIYVRWKKAEEFLQTNGTQYEVVTREGSIKWYAYPEVKIAKELAGELLKIEREFGMTPASRPEIKIINEGTNTTNGEESEEKDKERFFSKKENS